MEELTATHLYCGTGRVLQFNESVAFILEFVDLALVGQKTVVLKVLIKAKWSHLHFILQQLPEICYFSVQI